MIEWTSQTELFNDARHRTRAVARSEPAGNRHREPAGGAAGHDDMDVLGRRELRNHRLGLGSRATRDEPEIRALTVAFVGQERAIRLSHRFVKMAREVL